MLLNLILVVVVLFLLSALITLAIEHDSGTFGSYSMVPGCLIIMVIVVATILAFGYLSGKVGFWIN